MRCELNWIVVGLALVRREKQRIVTRLSRRQAARVSGTLLVMQREIRTHTRARVCDLHFNLSGLARLRHMNTHTKANLASWLQTVLAGRALALYIQPEHISARARARAMHLIVCAGRPAG